MLWWIQQGTEQEQLKKNDIENRIHKKYENIYNSMLHKIPFIVAYFGGDNSFLTDLSRVCWDVGREDVGTEDIREEEESCESMTACEEAEGCDEVVGVAVASWLWLLEDLASNFTWMA